jgi:chorismate mutase/prephenate dehydratase
MLVLPNRPGSLYSALSRFNALGINLIKLESRPLANSDFEFMFYFDLDTSVYSDAFLRIFDDLQSAVTMLKYLGSYTEVV